MMKGCKSIAEYAIRKWLQAENFNMCYFDLVMEGDEGIVKDGTGDAMRLVYNRETKDIYVAD